MEIAGRYFDGARPLAKEVRVRAAAGGLEILPGDGETIFWPYSEGRIDALTPQTRLHRVMADADTGERLVVAPDEFRRLFGAAIDRFGRGRAGEAGARRIALWCALAIGSLGLLYFVGLPAFARVAAPLVPWDWEASVGRSVEPQVLSFFGDGAKPVLCGAANAPGKAALEAMVGRLLAGARNAPPVRVDVLETAQTNAFALPGGRIFVLRPIIDRAASPDEVAGVLAHEIGHVLHRDAMRGLIEDGILSLMIGAVLGDVTGGSTATALSKMVLGSVYSRETESEADEASVELMRKAGADPRAINQFFARLAALEPAGKSILAALSSHPVTSERIAHVERLAAGAPTEARPILNADEWQALKAICSDHRSAEGG